MEYLLLTVKEYVALHRKNMNFVLCHCCPARLRESTLIVGRKNVKNCNKRKTVAVSPIINIIFDNTPWYSSMENTFYDSNPYDLLGFWSTVFSPKDRAVLAEA